MQEHGAPEEATVASSRPVVAAGFLARIGGGAGALLVLLILLVVSFGVAQRYLVGRPVPWADDLSAYLLLAMVMLGAAEALRRGDHIALDTLTSRLGPRGRHMIRLWADLAVLVFAALFAWSAWGQISFAYGFGEYTNGHIEIPSWIPMSPMLPGAALIGALAGARLVAGLRGLLRSGGRP